MSLLSSSRVNTLFYPLPSHSTLSWLESGRNELGIQRLSNRYWIYAGDTLLKLIQEYDGFKKESKPQCNRVAEAIMAVRDASQSDNWSNLLRGVIILTISLGFLSGEVSDTRT